MIIIWKNRKYISKFATFLFDCEYVFIQKIQTTMFYE